MIDFSTSGVETYWWLPPLVTFVISTIASTGGLSGAFLVLPFQISILGFVAPGVTPTNLIYSIVGIPSGVYRYWREGRMVWPLAFAIILGTIPGALLGAYVRVTLLPDPNVFKPFAGVVLGLIGIRMLIDIICMRGKGEIAHCTKESLQVSDAIINIRHVSFSYENQLHTISTPILLGICLIVGVAAGAYGLGGAAVIAPLLVTVFRIPVYTIAGATLVGSFAGSAFGLLGYWGLGLSGTTPPATADISLGLLLGVGGMAGMYVGARIQKYVPVKMIKSLLTFILLGIAVRYLSGLFQ